MKLYFIAANFPGPVFQPQRARSDSKSGNTLTWQARQVKLRWFHRFSLKIILFQNIMSPENYGWFVRRSLRHSLYNNSFCVGEAWSPFYFGISSTHNLNAKKDDKERSDRSLAVEDSDLNFAGDKHQAVFADGLSISWAESRDDVDSRRNNRVL